MEFWRGWPFPLAVGVLFVIVLLRAGGTYALGRAAHAGAERTRFARLIASPRFARAQRQVTRWGAPVVVASFLTVGIQTVVNLAAGVARMPLRRYLPALVIGGALWALLYAGVGFATVAALRRLYELSPAGAVAAGALLLAALAAYIGWQLRHRVEIEAVDADPVAVGPDPGAAGSNG